MVRLWGDGKRPGDEGHPRTLTGVKPLDWKGKTARELDHEIWGVCFVSWRQGSVPRAAYSTPLFHPALKGETSEQLAKYHQKENEEKRVHLGYWVLPVDVAMSLVYL